MVSECIYLIKGKTDVPTKVLFERFLFIFYNNGYSGKENKLLGFYNREFHIELPCTIPRHSSLTLFANLVPSHAYVLLFSI